MKSIIENAKALGQQIPEFAGRPLSRMPYVLRLGTAYSRAVSGIERSRHKDRVAREADSFAVMQVILRYAFDHVQFYREFYRSRGFHPSQVMSLDDWKSVPVVTRTDLQVAPYKRRVALSARGIRVNTGGTSGQPLDFLLDRQAFAREWAHMHAIWKSRGYQPRHVKLTFRGKHFDGSIPIRYNAVHNEYVVNASVPMAQVIEALAGMPGRRSIRWIHGYPSLVAEFAHALNAAPTLAASIRENLFGVLLGSEYPAPVYRAEIERALSSNVVSWYGHSEMAVLARETAVGVYESMPTYGYAEAVPVEGSTQGEYRLVCTSLHNRAHPFIRYDTGDLIEPLAQQGGALAFRIREGRIGDFVLDRQGNRLALTAIIFGRHHRAFDDLQHLQVRQETPGEMTLVVTPRDHGIEAATLAEGFDFSGLDLKWRLEVVEAPIRTAAGKIRLKL